MESLHRFLGPRPRKRCMPEIGQNMPPLRRKEPGAKNLVTFTLKFIIGSFLQVGELCGVVVHPVPYGLHTTSPTWCIITTHTQPVPHTALSQHTHNQSHMVHYHNTHTTSPTWCIITTHIHPVPHGALSQPTHNQSHMVHYHNPHTSSPTWCIITTHTHPVPHRALSQPTHIQSHTVHYHNTHTTSPTWCIITTHTQPVPHRALSQLTHTHFQDIQELTGRKNSSIL